MARMRVVSFMVQPVIFSDDGQDLTPVQVQPISLDKDQLQQFAANPQVALENVRRQIESEDDDG